MKNFANIPHVEGHLVTTEMCQHFRETNPRNALQVELLLLLFLRVGEEALEVLGRGSQHHPVDWKSLTFTDQNCVAEFRHLILVLLQELAQMGR